MVWIIEGVFPVHVTIDKGVGAFTAVNGARNARRGDGREFGRFAPREHSLQNRNLLLQRGPFGNTVLFHSSGFCGKHSKQQVCPSLPIFRPPGSGVWCLLKYRFDLKRLV